MGLVGQIGRLSPGSEEKLDGNAYLWLTALMGVVGWGPTAYLLHFGTDPPSGTVTLQEVGPWVEAASQYSWPLVWLWSGVFVLYLVVTVFRVERNAIYSVPNAVWTVGTAIALAANVAGVEYTIGWLVWLPWLVLFGVGYLTTGVLVTRGWVYLLAGAVSGLLAVYGVYATLEGTGALVITTEAPTLAGAVLFPVPLTYVVIGALHVVPVAVDALLGGRETTDRGIPAVKADRMSDWDEGGGVVPE